MTADLPVDRRRELFAKLVAKQDAGLGVPESRAAVGRECGVDAQQVLAIEKEGLKANWPPLDA